MRISTNVAALGTHRMLERTDRAVFRSVERMSSGARINRAADDAGGLSVSEGLRSRSAGMRQAVHNTRNGIDLLRTAEGALAETASVLQRMRDLAVQAANDGGLDASAKGLIQDEIDGLTQELTRIATTTAHNGSPLLDGNYRGTFQVGAEVGETLTFFIGAAGQGMDAAGLGVDALDVTFGTTGASGGVMAAPGSTPIRVTRAISDQEGTRTAGTIGLAGDFTTPGAYQASYTGLSGTISYAGRTLDLASISYAGDVSAGDYRSTFTSAVRSAFGLNGNPVSASSAELLIAGERPRNGSTIAEAQALSPTFAVPGGTPVTPPTPPTPPTPGAPSVPIGGPNDALSTIDSAIRRVSTTRAELGAVENRLEHTVARLGVAFDNTTAAYSRIRDTDMATEMTGLTRNEVLLEAGSAMLAQARQTPQSVLRLLT